MSRSFTGSSSQYLNLGSAVVSGPPFTIAAWFYLENSSHTFYSMPSIHNSSTTDAGNYHALEVDSSAVYAESKVLAADVGNYATSSAAPSIGAWQHACGVFSATNSRAAYLNGGNKGTNAGTFAPTVNMTDIGRLRAFAASPIYGTGRVAEVAIWDAALTDEEVASLAKGFAPHLIRPGNLVSYWPLLGNTSPEIDIISANGLTLVNAPTKIEHPPIYK